MLTRYTHKSIVAITTQKKGSHSLATVSNLDTKAGVERLPLFFLCDVSPYLHFSGLHRTGDFYSLSVSEITDSPTCPIQPFLFLAKHIGLPINLFYLGGATMHTNATATQSPYYCATFNNPSLSMSIKLKDMSDKYQRFVDFQAAVMFPVQSDNSIKINSFQYEKIMDIISMELAKFVKDGFPTPKTQITEQQFNITGDTPMPKTQAIQQISTPVKMTTVEVAEQTGKEHRNVLRDTRNMLTELYGEGGLLRFEQTYKDVQGKEYTCYSLPKIELLTLVSGYSIPMRAKIIRRLDQLEIEKQQGTLTTSVQTQNINVDAIFSKLEAVLQLESRISALETKRTRKAKEVPALKEHTLFENQEALHNQHLDLIEKAIALAADSGKPFTHKRLHGIYEKRNRLSKELQHLGRKPLESMTQQLLYSGRVVKCRLALGAGRKQWLDVPTGNFGQGNGVIHR